MSDAGYDLLTDLNAKTEISNSAGSSIREPITEPITVKTIKKTDKQLAKDIIEALTKVEKAYQKTQSTQTGFAPQAEESENIIQLPLKIYEKIQYYLNLFESMVTENNQKQNQLENQNRDLKNDVKKLEIDLKVQYEAYKTVRDLTVINEKNIENKVNEMYPFFKIMQAQNGYSNLINQCLPAPPSNLGKTIPFSTDESLFDRENYQKIAQNYESGYLSLLNHSAVYISDLILKLAFYFDELGEAASYTTLELRGKLKEWYGFSIKKFPDVLNPQKTLHSLEQNFLFELLDFNITPVGKSKKFNVKFKENHLQPFLEFFDLFQAKNHLIGKINKILQSSGISSGIILKIFIFLVENANRAILNNKEEWKRFDIEDNPLTQNWNRVNRARNILIQHGILIKTKITSKNCSYQLNSVIFDFVIERLKLEGIRIQEYNPVIK